MSGEAATELIPDGMYVKAFCWAFTVVVWRVRRPSEHEYR
jgi:hypothetical protein